MDLLKKTFLSKGVEPDQHYLDIFWKFIYDRQLVWYRRFVLEQKAPWTDDPILNQYKFTNVYRELDRGTIFLLDNIINNEHSVMEQVFNIIVYRMFNRIETWQATGFINIKTQRANGLVSRSWPKEVCFAVWRKRMEEGKPLYTDAHMVCAYEHFPGKDKLERFEHIFRGVFKSMSALMHCIKFAKSLQTVWKFLTDLDGIGPFLAYEIAVDISYCEWNNLGEDEWVNAGPGCQRGLKKIFPGLRTQDCAWLIKVLRQAQVAEFKRLDLRFFDIAYKGRELTLRNIEHCCCEGFKWFKALEGTGRPRNSFTAKAIKGTADFKRLRG